VTNALFTKGPKVVKSERNALLNGALPDQLGQPIQKPLSSFLYLFFLSLGLQKACFQAPTLSKELYVLSWVKMESRNEFVNALLWLKKTGSLGPSATSGEHCMRWSKQFTNHSLLEWSPPTFTSESGKRRETLSNITDHRWSCYSPIPSLASTCHWAWYMSTAVMLYRYDFDFCPRSLTRLI